MQDDEQAIRDLFARWLRATAADDVKGILPLMAEDVVFLRPGHPPMRGRDEFAASFNEAIGKMRIESDWKAEEIRVTGDVAWCWSNLTITVAPRSGGASVRRSGSVLSILRRKSDRSWEVVRDANMLMPEDAG
jgi:uncharacterized protein (TIGR02246 family)